MNMTVLNKKIICDALVEKLTESLPNSFSPGGIKGGMAEIYEELNFQHQGVVVNLVLRVECIDTNSKDVDQWSIIQSSNASSEEKIRMVKIATLALADGATIQSKNGGKDIFLVKVYPQLAGKFEFDDSKTVSVTVKASSRIQAYEAIARHISNGRYGAYSTDGRNLIAEAGRWYDGNKIKFELVL